MQAPSLNKLKQLLLQTGKKNWLQSNSMLHGKKELNRWAKVLMLSEGEPSPLPAGHRKTCLGELSPLSFFTGFPPPSRGWKLDSTYGTGWILFWPRLLCRWKNILHSFHILLGFFFLGCFAARPTVCVVGVEAPPDDREIIFLSCSLFFMTTYRLTMKISKIVLPSGDEFSLRWQITHPHVPMFPPSVKEAMRHCGCSAGCP